MDHGSAATAVRGNVTALTAHDQRLRTMLADRIGAASIDIATASTMKYPSATGDPPTATSSATCPVHKRLNVLEAADHRQNQILDMTETLAKPLVPVLVLANGIE